MYTDFFGFTEKPFSLVPNPNYLYLSYKHGHALTFLEYGLAEKVGFVMLTGEIGIGKTTLIRHMLNKIEDDMDVAVIFNTNIMSTDLIHMILDEFEVEYTDGIGKAKALNILYDFLIEKYADKRKVLLIIDEAQNLSDEVLEEIRMLSNLQTDEDMLLQIMIVGQPNLRDKIQDPGLEQFAQRISVSYHLSAMTQEETGAYIAHRLKKAGGGPEIFSMEFVEKIFEVSGGIPRTINLLCDAALLYGYADSTKEIGLDILEQVIEDKGGMGVFTKQKLNNTAETILKDDSQEKLKDKISKLELRTEQLARAMNGQLKRTESRAEFCRDEMVSTLKSQLEAERKRSAGLEYMYGKLKGKYDFFTQFKRVQ
ncbi:MAG: AAA family ATPase [Desulfobacula sp.]|jgi:general secretion pathway protein A|uniref:ExeA family protein n=1 Tax=Desulfobacula sp. TaxID=2593537 RepID=UPI001D7FA48E|nr:AAA family ATPase [Desulfobacula sp.]MBT3487181.1 AAA family ATPase [Desulfobacula sp.]MBT3806084.1 AAA family ATPase [Desulfobacula sp.]MBT4026743.1 AAA family ATPase [Desulfobacula sp.]MBT4199436.1 AAA family ATPase [Desulfobacula sp.]